MSKSSSNKKSSGQFEELLKVLKTRFEKNMGRHKGIEWSNVQAKLEANPKKLSSLNEMEITEGEPDVVGHDKKRQVNIFFMIARRKVQRVAEVFVMILRRWHQRKEHKPAHSAIGMAEEMGVELLTEEQYRDLQKLGKFDTKTSSWIKTPADIRKLGGAIFADYRYGTVFVYHNGAESYYSGRAFRGSLKV